MIKTLAGGICAASILLAPVSAIARDKEDAADPNKRICRGEMTTGSLMAKSVCHTRAEWKKIDEPARTADDSARTFLQGEAFVPRG